jgi:hypothetical protein
MQRNQLIQSLINKHNFKSYMEIGVREGHVFFLIKCKNKIAIDPNFAFQWKQNIKRFISLLTGSQFYAMTSDDFFAKHANKVLSTKKLDVALIDGMHEMDFALRDILNSLRYLSDDGFVIVHDCNPISAERACSFEEWKGRDYEGVWNGDVWKSILYLIRNRTDLEVFVIDTDNGLGVIRKSNGVKSTENIDPASFEVIRKMTYSDLEKSRTEFLNLKQTTSIKQLLNV